MKKASVFRNVPMCESCGLYEAVSFSDCDGEWKFTCHCTSDTESYYVMIDRFFDNPAATVDWLAHISEKTWFKPDDFFAMLRRFRKATGSFNAM